MRLDKLEKEALQFAFEGIEGDFFLFGSRANDTRKGGDIDVLVYTNQPAYDTSKTISVRFFLKCESKIDLLVINPQNITPEQKAFIECQKLIPLKL